MSVPGKTKSVGAIRLVVVDDSPYYRVRFSKLFGRSDGVDVVGVAADGEEAIRLIAHERPDVVMLDLTMPRMDGFSVLRWAMSHLPVAIVVCSSRSDRESIFKALELGAVDYITKPESGAAGLKAIEGAIVDRVRAAAKARLGSARRGSNVPSVEPLPASRRPAELIAIAASTGGPASIQRLARQLPRELTVPVVVAQHMPPGFTRLFADRLGRVSHYEAVEAVDGAEVRAGTIYVAPGGMQTRVDRRDGVARFTVAARRIDDVYAPSADMLFESAASAFGASAVAVVLTGMGDDGSRGAVAVRGAGGYVIAETSDSALIYGMPRAAVATGCANAQLPLASMAEAFLTLSAPGA